MAPFVVSFRKCLVDALEKSSDQSTVGATEEVEDVTTGIVAEVLITSFITRSFGKLAILDCAKTVAETVKTQTNSKIFFIVSFFS